MARLQILELPAGPADERPPFILVIDEVAGGETERLVGAQEAIDGIAKKVGARAVAVFHGMTIDIPANAAPAVSSAGQSNIYVDGDARDRAAAIVEKFARGSR